MSAKTGPGGRIVLKIAVPARGTLAVRATTTTTGAARVLTFAKATRSVRPGTVKITLKPTRAAKKLLARRRQLSVKIRAVFTPAGGGKATVLRISRVVKATN